MDTFTPPKSSPKRAQSSLHRGLLGLALGGLLVTLSSCTWGGTAPKDSSGAPTPSATYLPGPTSNPSTLKGSWKVFAHETSGEWVLKTIKMAGKTTEIPVVNALFSVRFFEDEGLVRFSGLPNYKVQAITLSPDGRELLAEGEGAITEMGGSPQQLAVEAASLEVFMKNPKISREGETLTFTNTEGNSLTYVLFDG